MSAILLVARSELRRRRGSALTVLVLVAVGVSTVLTAFAGARRTSTAFDRLREVTLSADARIQIDDPELGEDVYPQILQLPEVVAGGLGVLYPTAPDVGDEAVDVALVADPTGRHLFDIDRPLVLAGRLPSNEAATEVACLLAWLPGRMAGRTPLSITLRAE